MFENDLIALFGNPFFNYSLVFLSVCIGFRLLLTGIAKVVQSVHGKSLEIYLSEADEKPIAEATEPKKQPASPKKSEQANRQKRKSQNNSHNLRVSQRPRERRTSLEQKTKKIFEEEARKEKLSIWRNLLLQTLQENHLHCNAVKELDKKLREENRTHDDAVKELEEKIAELQTQIESSSEVENILTERSSKPAQEMSEPHAR